jgi:outer membrane protein assembly factor BamA
VEKIGRGKQFPLLARLLFACGLVLTLVLFPPRAVYAFQLTDPNTWPCIPIPEVATDPNGGTTYGLMAVFLNHKPDGSISSIFAPDVTNNSTLGPGGNFRFLGYPSSDTHWYAIGGGTETKQRQVDLSYSTGRDRQNWWSFDGELFWEHDPTERFYGIGNNTSSTAQSNYTLEQTYLETTLGINVSEEFQVGLDTRARYVRIATGAFNSLPYTGTEFPHLKGLDGGSEFFNELVAKYDSRDHVDLPTQGGLYRLFFGLTQRGFGSSFSYTRFGTELSHYIPLSRRFVLATHALIEYMPAGDEPPFWSLARLGGESSDFFVDRSTLRGFGTARFTDNNIIGFNAEMRTKLFSAHLFDTKGTAELAPFLDLGKVSHDFTDNPFINYHLAGGVGLRAIAEPFVVGYLDIGYAGSGIAIFTGIDYPF